MISQYQLEELQNTTEKSNHCKGKPGRDLNQFFRNIREEFSTPSRDNSVPVKIPKKVDYKSVLSFF